jgi:DNA polymerase-3 subunit beta
MKFTVSSGELLSRLSVVGKAIATKSNIPILDHFLFTIKGDKLNIRGSDSEITIDTTLNISDVEGEGSYVIPGDKMSEYLRKLPEQPIHFNINVETNTIETTTLTGITKQSAYSAEEYPVIAGIDPAESSKFTVDSDIVLNGISKTVFATSNDEIRPALTGIYLSLQNGEMTFVATDSHMLSRYTVSGVESDTVASIILTKKTAQLLKTVLSKGEPVTVEYNNKMVKFTSSTYVFMSRLIEAVYPQYNKLIPTDNPYTITINRSDLLNTISRASVFANGSFLVKFMCSADNVKVIAQDTDMQCSSQETLQCVYNGQPTAIGFKATLIIDILSNMTSDEINISIGDPSRAGLIMPSKPSDKESELMLLMPMMIS